jgi:hypothetical protein
MALPAAPIPEITDNAVEPPDAGPRPGASAKPVSEGRIPGDAKTSGARTTVPPERSAEAPTTRRGPKKHASKAAGSTPVTRYFLTKAGNNGKPELDRELENENEAMIEALKESVTFLALTEWRPMVDNSTPGRPVIEKEAVSRSK